jgi:DNA-binding LacI/PurR family transcriptional regulator
MITINDVAKRAGVSISTVSNVLNKNKYVSEELTHRVTTAVREMKYTANSIAQKMKFKYTKTIGVITADLCGLFYPYIFKGMYDVFNAEGYRLIVMDYEGTHDTRGIIKKLRDNMTNLINDRVDGIVFASMGSEELEIEVINDIMKNANTKKNTGIVCIEKNLSKYGIDSIYTNSLINAKIATTHLIDIGCKHIGHITGPINFSVAKDRMLGFKKALQSKDLKFDKNKMFANGNYTHQSGYLAMKELLMKMSEIDGVFVANDQMSVGALKALSEAGRRVPEDVRVIGHDNVFIASALEPSLSTIHVQKQYMGKKAAELLLSQIENNEEYGKHTPTAIKMESKLIIRKSTVKDASESWILVDW